jgi:FkbM family methyltransferase
MIKNLIHSTAGAFGYRINRIDPSQSSHSALEQFFSLLKSFQFNPEHLLDVGANHGNWTRTALAYFPNAQYTLVEPQDHLKVHIKNLRESGRNIRWINAGVADRSGTMPFTISYRDDSSSFALTEEQASMQGYQRVDIEVKTINEIVAMSGGPIPAMVKIDAEGFDLKALAGASDLFGKTEIFLVEAVICAPDYENTIAKVVSTMAAAEYRVIEVTDMNRSPKHGVLWLCELAFLRNASRLFEAATSYE